MREKEMRNPIRSEEACSYQSKLYGIRKAGNGDLFIVCLIVFKDTHSIWHLVVHDSAGSIGSISQMTCDYAKRQPTESPEMAIHVNFSIRLISISCSLLSFRRILVDRPNLPKPHTTRDVTPHAARSQKKDGLSLLRPPVPSFTNPILDVTIGRKQ